MALTEKQQEEIDKIKQKSDDDYEKNVVYIAAGTLVLSMTFLEKIIKLENSSHVWVLVASWAFLAGTLFCNLLSHQLSSVFHERCRDNFDNCGELADDATEQAIEEYEQNLSVANRKFEFYNRTIRLLNWGTTITLFIGIVLLVIFCSANALNAKSNTGNNNVNNTTMSKQVKTQSPSVDTTKGRTISASVKPTSQSNNTTSNSGNQSSSTSNSSNQTTSR